MAGTQRNTDPPYATNSGDRPLFPHSFRNGSGSFAMFAAIRPASSRKRSVLPHDDLVADVHPVVEIDDVVVD